MKYLGWALFAIVVFIPATAVNRLLWAVVPCEWHRPYRKVKR